MREMGKWRKMRRMREMREMGKWRKMRRMREMREMRKRLLILNFVPPPEEFH
jgi:hypothetical protein